MFDLDRLAHNACCLRRGATAAQRFLSMLLHTCSVLSWRVLDHLRVGGERVGLQDRLSVANPASRRQAQFRLLLL
jgi:hypothetical protein